jgi:hypothetical protein
MAPAVLVPAGLLVPPLAVLTSVCPLITGLDPELPVGCVPVVVLTTSVTLPEFSSASELIAVERDSMAEERPSRPEERAEEASPVIVGMPVSVVAEASTAGEDSAGGAAAAAAQIWSVVAWVPVTVSGGLVDVQWLCVKTDVMQAE